VFSREEGSWMLVQNINNTGHCHVMPAPKNMITIKVCETFQSG
jgi:hypothetical protein